jgi:hypothetical protein
MLKEKEYEQARRLLNSLTRFGSAVTHLRSRASHSALCA